MTEYTCYTSSVIDQPYIPVPHLLKPDDHASSRPPSPGPNRRDGFSYCLLGLIGIRPMTGYDIKRALRTSIGYIWSATESQIYTALNQLERRGLVVSKQLAGKGRRKKVYELTPAGREELASWLRGPVAERFPKDEFLLRLFFMGQGSDNDALAHLEAHRERLRQIIAYCQQVLSRYSPKDIGERQRILAYQLLVLHHHMTVLEADLAATEAAIETVRNGFARQPGAP